MAKAFATTAPSASCRAAAAQAAGSSISGGLRRAASAVAVVAFTAAMHAGQGCAITTRLVVPRNRYDEAVDATRRADALFGGVGDLRGIASAKRIGGDALRALGALGEAERELREASALARRKTAGERHAIRREAFRSYFAHATEASKALTELCMERAPAPSAIPPDRLLVGLADTDGRDLGLGIVSGIDPDAGRLAVLTPLDLDYASRMRRGTFMLDQDFTERPLAPSSSPSD